LDLSRRKRIGQEMAGGETGGRKIRRRRDEETERLGDLETRTTGTTGTKR
jgi:hypothetical protein